MLLAGLQFSIEIANGNESDEATILIGHGEMPDAAFAHGGSRFLGSGGWGTADDIDGHDFVDACFFWVSSFGDDSTQEIPFRENPDDLIIAFNDQCADSMPIHFVSGFVDGGGDMDFPDGISLLVQQFTDLSHELPQTERGDGNENRRDFETRNVENIPEK